MPLVCLRAIRQTAPLGQLNQRLQANEPLVHGQGAVRQPAGGFIETFDLVGQPQNVDEKIFPARHQAGSSLRR